MKSLSFYFLLFFTSSVFAQQTTKVSGKITNPAGEKVYVYYINNYLNWTNAYLDSATLDKNGNFAMSFALKSPVSAYFKHGDEHSSIYLFPGDDLTLQLNSEEFDETITYIGKGAEKNNYLAAKLLLEEKYDAERYENYKLPANEYVAKSDKIKTKVLELLENKMNGVKDKEQRKFISWEKDNIDYSFANAKMMYPMYYSSFTKEKAELPATYYNFLKTLKINNPELMNSSDYIAFIEDYTRNQYVEQVKIDTTIKDRMSEWQLEFINSKFTGPVKEFALARVIDNQIKFLNESSEAGKNLDVFKKEFPRSTYYTSLEKTYNKALKLKAGNPAPDFLLPDLEGEKVSLKDFEGKIIYMDIWASWCGPCLMQVPYAKKLKEELEGEDVVFLYVSMDEKEETWRNTIEKKEIEGVHLISPGNWSSEIAGLYNVYSIPRYILIGKDGKIINSQAASPSGKAKQQILNALGK